MIVAIPVPAFVRAINRRVPRQIRERIVLTAFSVGWTVAALSFWEVRQFEMFLPVFWPIWYAITAGVCWAFLLCPYSRTLLVVSGACSFVALLSRAGGVLLNMLGGHYDATSVWYGVIGLVVYPLFALALLYVWDVGFRTMREQRTRSGGPRAGSASGG